MWYVHDIAINLSYGILRNDIISRECVCNLISHAHVISIYVLIFTSNYGVVVVCMHIVVVDLCLWGKFSSTFADWEDIE